MTIPIEINVNQVVPLVFFDTADNCFFDDLVFSRLSVAQNGTLVLMQNVWRE